MKHSLTFDFTATLRFNDDLTLIDEEEDEDEESEEDELDESGLMDSQTVSFTLDPQTQSMLTGDDGQVVVFEVVQMPGEEGGGEEGQTFEAVETPKRGFVAKGRSKAVRTVLSQSNGNSASGDNNIIIQLQTEDDEAANTITGSIIDDSDFEPTRRITKSSVSSVPPPVGLNDPSDIRDKLQKQRDIAQCFGFKDDDDEDDALLLLPASAAQ